MTVPKRSPKSILASILAAGVAMAFTACSSSDSTAESPDESQTVAQEAPAEPVDIPVDTPAGEESQRIVDLLNAEEDTDTEDWEDSLHSSFTAEVSTEELVELFNQNLRPAQPFTATSYDGGDRQAITTLTSPISEPIDMTVTLDAEGLITGLFFGESDPAG